jgi:hypothetical protein
MDTKQNVFTKGAIAFLSIVMLWNVTKLPFYMSFNNDGNIAYNDHGIELSINLGHWVKGYRSLKMRTPACNFILVHAALGLTILFMMILTLIHKEWRNKYCRPFFCFAILEGFHALPASLINDAGLAPLFLFACVALVGSGVWGLKTNLEYAQDPTKAEKHLLIQYTIITVINSFAAFLETPNIIKAFKTHSQTGVWKDYGDVPHKLVGHTLYDTLPEKVGMTFFLGFCFVVWFVWPLYLLDTGKGKSDEDNDSNGEEGETTPLYSKVTDILGFRTMA